MMNSMGLLTKRLDEKNRKRALIIKEILITLVFVWLALSHREAYLQGFEACKVYSCYFCHMNDSLSYLFNQTPPELPLNLSNITYNTTINENWLVELWRMKT